MPFSGLEVKSQGRGEIWKGRRMGWEQWVGFGGRGASSQVARSWEKYCGKSPERVLARFANDFPIVCRTSQKHRVELSTYSLWTSQCFMGTSEKWDLFVFGLWTGAEEATSSESSVRTHFRSQPLRAPDSLTASFILGWNQVVLVQKEVAEQGKEMFLSSMSGPSEGNRTSYIVWIIKKSRKKISMRPLAHNAPEFWVSITHSFVSVIVSIIISLICVTAGRKDLVHLDLFPVLGRLVYLTYRTSFTKCIFRV